MVTSEALAASREPVTNTILLTRAIKVAARAVIPGEHSEKETTQALVLVKTMNCDEFEDKRKHNIQKNPKTVELMKKIKSR